MTSLAEEQTPAPGKLILTMPSGEPVRIAYDGRAFHAAVEEIPIDNAELRQSWGERLYRILLRADTPPLQSKWTLRITR